MIKCNPSIVKEDGKVFKYDFGVICWILGAILAYYIMLVTIVTDLIFFIVEFVLLIATALGCALHIIWTTIIAMLDAICKWTIEWEKKCVDWAQESIKECLEYQTTGYQECSEYQDQGYNACTEYQDQGYSACAQTADQDIITVALGGPALGVVKQWYGFPI